MPLDFSLTREQEEIRALAHDFAEREIRPRAAYYDEREEMPWEIMRKAHAVGLSPMSHLPEKYGGEVTTSATQLSGRARPSGNRM